jgi:hypothetical protein
MSNFMVSFLMAVGVGGWVYARVLRASGGNQQSALLVAGIIGVVVLLAVNTTLTALFS